MGAAFAPLMLGTSLIGGAITAAGKARQYEGAAANAAYQAQVADNNATIARENAGMDIQQGEVRAGIQGLKTRAEVGRTLAGQAASGVDVNSGSFASKRSSEAELGLLDAMTIRSDAAKRAWSDEIQASNYEAEAGLQRQESKQAQDAAPVAFLGSMFSSASAAGGQYYKYMQTIG